MLDVLRRNAGSWAIKIILGFIAITFVWWGVGTYSEREREIAATVGDETVSMSELAEATAGMEKVYRDVYGASYTPEMAKAMNFRKQALDTLVQRTLLLAEARKLGLTASDAEVQREIASTPAFQVNGQFSEERYQSVLAYNRIAAASYEDSKRRDITLGKIEGLLVANALVPESEARDLFDLRSRKIRLMAVVADPERMKTVPPPTEGEIAENYAQARENYRIPARVKLLVARFEPGHFAQNASASEEEIRAFYEGNADKFRTEEQRLVSQIYLPYTPKNRAAIAKAAAEVVAEAGKGKAEFENVAKKVSRTKTGETWLRRGEARPEAAAELFSAPVDSVVGPIDVGDGLLILRVNRIKFPESLPLSQVRDRVTALLQHEKGKDLAVIKAYEAHTKAVAAKDLAGACAPYGITPGETGWVGQKKEESVPAALVEEALLLPAKEIGPVKTIGDVHYLYQVAAKEDSRIPELADVREKIASAVLRQKQRAAARSELEKSLAGTKSASELERKAKQAGFSVAVTGFFPPHSGPYPEIVPETGNFRKILLSLSKKAPVYGSVTEASGRFFALAFVDEQRADEREWSAKRQAFLREVAEMKKNRIVEAFIASALARAKVEINPEALK